MAAEITNTGRAQPELPHTWLFSTSQLQRTLPSSFAGWSAWHYVVAFLLGVVVYDQGTQECLAYGILHPADTVPSHIHEAKGTHRWTSVQGSAHRPVSPSALSKV
jgi:hypothetical protein